MKFWAIVGDANTRKSSAVAGLTGANRRHPSWQIQPLRGTVIHAYIEIRSLQERPRCPTPAQFVAEVHKAVKKHKDTKYVLVPRRHGGRTKPKGIDYIKHFSRVAGWKCIGIALTGSNKDPGPFRRYNRRAFKINPNSTPYAPSNIVAAQLRTAWGIK